VFSRRPAPASVPAGVEFVQGSIAEFVARVRKEPGKNLWLMGGGEIIGAFLDEGAIDELVVTMVPTLIGDGIPLIARKHRDVPLRLRSATPFPDGVVQLHYEIAPGRRSSKRRR
jgi:dihydrofolate reductase